MKNIIWYLRLSIQTLIHPHRLFGTIRKLFIFSFLLITFFSSIIPLLGNDLRRINTYIPENLVALSPENCSYSEAKTLMISKYPEVNCNHILTRNITETYGSNEMDLNNMNKLSFSNMYIVPNYKYVSSLHETKITYLTEDLDAMGFIVSKKIMDERKLTANYPLSFVSEKDNINLPVIGYFENFTHKSLLSNSFSLDVQYTIVLEKTLETILKTTNLVEDKANYFLMNMVMEFPYEVDSQLSSEIENMFSLSVDHQIVFSRASQDHAYDPMLKPIELLLQNINLMLMILISVVLLLLLFLKNIETAKQNKLFKILGLSSISLYGVQMLGLTIFAAFLGFISFGTTSLFKLLIESFTVFELATYLELFLTNILLVTVVIIISLCASLASTFFTKVIVKKRKATR